MHKYHKLTRKNDNLYFSQIMSKIGRKNKNAPINTRTIYIAELQESIETQYRGPLFGYIVLTESGSYREQCAVESLAILLARKRDSNIWYLTMEQYSEYLQFVAVNRKAIDRQEKAQYKL